VTKAKKVQRALKVSGDDDVVAADDTDGVSDNVPPPPHSIERGEKRPKRALEEAKGVPPVDSLSDIILDTIPRDIVEPDIPLDAPDGIDDRPDIEV
jgi:hypothetical protein